MEVSLEGAWIQVVNIDMWIKKSTCPSGLNCSIDIVGGGCSSATLAVQYSHVCGKIIGVTR